jgi:hypothetical protein
MTGFMDRVLGAVRLDGQLYKTVAEDQGATSQSLWIIAIYGMASGFAFFGKTGAAAINMVLLTTLLGWYIWAFFTYYLGTKIFSEPQTNADRKAVYRAMGFAASAGWIRALGVVPGIAWLAILVSTVWMLIASVIAVKQALDYTSTLRAVGVCVLCWCISMIVQMTLLVILISAFGISTPAA